MHNLPTGRLTTELLSSRSSVGQALLQRGEIMPIGQKLWTAITINPASGPMVPNLSGPAYTTINPYAAEARRPMHRVRLGAR